MITILGPTACGKTSFACRLAATLDGEILSADSRQVYRGMDIGTGKDLDDYVVDGRQIPYHLIDIRPAGDQYNIYEYIHDFHRAYDDVLSRGKMPIFCGGSGLYIESVLKGYQMRMSAEEKFDPVDSLIVGVNIDRETRRQRITSRLKSRLENGMVEEIESLIKSGVSTDALIRYGLEYKFITLYIMGKLSYDEMFTQLEIAIHQFAKRQMTWFRGMETRGFKINWIDYTLSDERKCSIVTDLLQK